MRRALILAGIKWNTTMQRHHMVAQRLVELGFEVYFMEGIVSSSFDVKKLTSRISRRLKRPLANSDVDIKVGNVKIVNTKFANPHGGLFAMYNAHHWSELQKTIPDSFDVIINYLPISTTERIIGDLACSTLIYDCVRDFSNWGGYPSGIDDLEKRLIERADYVMVDSYYLHDKITKKYPLKQVRQMLPMLKTGQAAIFSQNKLPKKIKNISYIGQVGAHIDTDIFIKLSEAGYNIHVFGNSLIDLPDDIVMHGFISDPAELAEKLIASSDALVIPYKGRMDGVIPAKLFECLATNLPVYVSNFYDARVIDDMVYVYKNSDDLVSMVNSYDPNEQKGRNIIAQRYLRSHSTMHELGVLDKIVRKK